MSTNNANASVATELERLESEKLIGESVVNNTRDRYAAEFGNAAEIERMRMMANLQPKTYRIPKRVKWERRPFIDKLKKLFGIESTTAE